jgi:hypothetical protein
MGLEYPQLKKKENILIEWRELAAYYASTKGTKAHLPNYITLDELVNEVMPLLSHYAPITIEAQIPVFTVWAENALKESMPSRKNNSWYRPRHY